MPDMWYPVPIPSNEFEGYVISTLGRLSVRYDDLYKGLLGNGQPGRIQVLESRLGALDTVVESKVDKLSSVVERRVSETVSELHKNIIDLHQRVRKAEQRLWWFTGAAAGIGALAGLAGILLRALMK